MNRLTAPLFAATVASGTLLVAAASPIQKPMKAAKPGTSKVDAFSKQIAPLVLKYCSGCHGESAQAGGLSVTKFKTTADVLKGRDMWERISRMLADSAMPPTGSPAPTPAERERLVAWIDSTLSQADCNLKDPGRVTMRRLNREEYNNTIRDLLGVTLRPGDDFPSDDVGYGFDNIGDVLSISPLLMEKYLSAAEKVSRAVIQVPGSPKAVKSFSGNDLKCDQGYRPDDEGEWVITSNGEVYAEYAFPKDDTYVIRALCYGDQAGKDPVRISLKLDGQVIGTADVTVTKETAKRYDFTVRAGAGNHRISVAFINDFFDPKAANPNDRDRNFVIQRLEVSAPATAQTQTVTEAHRRIIPEPPVPGSEEAAARKYLAPLASRAFRRPARPEEVDRLVRLVKLGLKEKQTFDRSMQLALQAVLVSPHFLFRVEIDRDPKKRNSAHPVGDYELASRLSYFLWASMPDEELFNHAAKHRLSQPKVLEAQVRRMLKDAKAISLVQNFGEQWLTLRNLASASPERSKYRGWNESLRQAMKKETELFLAYVMQDDRSVLECLDSRYTFLNDRLAKHYGIEGVEGAEFRRVELTDGRRGGLLTQASILTLTSNPTRTSPVKRGKWVLEQIMGTPPPPAPPNVPQLGDDTGRPVTGTLRERMEQHRKDPTCASCHTRMDAIGFGLENFDAVGAWRDQDGGLPVDPSGSLPGGKSFQGPSELKKILLGQKDQFVGSLSEKLLTYALGRGLESYDKCAIQKIAQTVKKRDYRFSALVTEIVQSEPFRMRRGDGGSR